MKIQYVSDLHLEFYDKYQVHSLLKKIISKTDICVLAGDIGYPFQDTYEAFIRGISKKFKTVFIIHGNHEYYQLDENIGKTMDDMVVKTKDIVADLDNVHFLHNSYHDLNGYRFIGSTLWSYIHDHRYLVNDSISIHNFGADNINKLHLVHATFLKQTLDQCKKDDMKAVVITHHLPSFSLVDPQYKYSKHSQCFAASCDDLITDPVQCWIYGHTHTANKSLINNIPCITNPIGYVIDGSKENADPDFNRIIVLPSRDICA
jgi:predicted phosphohydrolase